MTALYDVCVVGLGGMGSAAAYQLAKRGARVIGFEQYGAGHSSGSSHGETRLIRQAYFEHENYVPLLCRAYELWDETAKEARVDLFKRCGVLIFCPEQGSVVFDGIRRSSKTHDLPLEIYDQQRASLQFPTLTCPDGFVAAYEGNAGLLLVEACVKAQTELARRHGAHLHFRENVRRCQRSAGHFTLETDTNTIKTKVVVITAGAWAKDFLPDVPIKPFQVSQHWFAGSKGYSLADGLPCFAYDLSDGFYYGFPAVSERGVKMALHAPGLPLSSPHEQLLQVPASDVATIKSFAERYFPSFDPCPRESSNCMYTMTPDEHFVIDRRDDGVVFAAGFSGHGFKFSSVMGEVLADLALDGTSRHPISFLRSSRWQEA